MYFGSVKFFKHVILTVVFGWIGVATVLAVFFAVRCHMLEKEAENAGTAAVPDSPATIDEYVEMMKGSGYTSADILYAVEMSDPEGFAGYTGNTSNAVSGGNALPAGLPARIDRETETQADGRDDVPGLSGENGEGDVPGMSDTSEEAGAGSPAVEQTDRRPNGDEDGEVLRGNGEPTVPAKPGDTAELTEMFPEMYAQKSPVTKMPSDKTVYLTFDDGPSAGTYDILYILQKHGIKATFFMSAGKTEQSREQMAAVAEAGHTIGVHSFAHDPDKIYASPEAFLMDFYETYKMIYDATGVKPDIYRLPEGGSPEVLSAVRKELDRRGFTEYPANCDSGDRDSGRSWQHIYDTSIANISSMNGGAILHLHDSADDYITVLTVDDIITDLEAAGYSFEALDNSVR
ncbi:MAG: polysaccharide deacetylase family protein [Ruminococcus sp.]|nr:polysaccharide deacetylase family protein [Ruminococcus sp.]